MKEDEITAMAQGHLHASPAEFKEVMKEVKKKQMAEIKQSVRQQFQKTLPKYLSALESSNNKILTDAKERINSAVADQLQQLQQKIGRQECDLKDGITKLITNITNKVMNLLKTKQKKEASKPKNHKKSLQDA
ncbi:unnamed protein product [Cylindrotheca closterium]|uniref:Uncharacterized protein n=1 Tax=Cylindrotheca closterium TaxID=2856 RepID=A0AAD2CJT4_9STRA|nr:unnamed protein product [Cylindrotheca closterium]